MNAPESSHSLIGTWRLVSFELRDDEGAATRPFGEDPVGFITYTPGRRMSVQFGRAERSSLETDDWLGATPGEIVAAARDFYSYCGTYDYRDGQVLHHIEVSLMPNWIGGTQRRFVSFNGDMLTLSTPPIQFAGKQQIATLVWQRV